MSLGLVEARGALSMLRHGLHAGWYSGEWEGSLQSVGYHGKEGQLFPSPADSRWEWEGVRGMAPPFSVGDVVGCGVDLGRGVLFFTLNGRPVVCVRPRPGSLHPPELPGCLASVPLLHIHPIALHHTQLAMCLSQPGDRVRVNLGQERFLFDLGTSYR